MGRINCGCLCVRWATVRSWHAKAYYSSNKGRNLTNAAICAKQDLVSYARRFATERSKYYLTALASIPLGEQYRARRTSDANVRGISQTVISPSCDHGHDSPVGAVAKHFVFVEPRDLRNYKLGDQSLLINHRGDSMCQLGRLATSLECCVLHRQGCIGCALALAKRLNIKMVVC